ncbi:hypothetical protein [Streptomyces sp. NBC_01304]|uniref:hypothetical protein n=1 Tax=Streptomyces sp. NBC_01304 TaxID=2903818 RepID=UPI002E0E1F4E|nr:hypothetical protein OG430_44905 [Streptomyces sp. NBC_01304]
MNWGSVGDWAIAIAITVLAWWIGKLTANTKAMDHDFRRMAAATAQLTALLRKTAHPAATAPADSCDCHTTQTLCGQNITVRCDTCTTKETGRQG